MRAAVSTVERTAATPERCPAMRGRWRRLAQRPFPSMMMAMWWGSRSDSRRAKISASLRFSPAGTCARKAYL
jgi:hypothetical protein